MVAQPMKANELVVAVEPLMVDIPKAAEICCVSPAKMKQWAKEKRVKSVKIDRCRRILMADLRVFVLSLKDEAPPEVTPEGTAAE